MKQLQKRSTLIGVFALCMLLFSACGPKIPTEFAPTIKQHFIARTETLTVNGTVELPDESYVCVTLRGRGEFTQMLMENIDGMTATRASDFCTFLEELPASLSVYAQVADGAFSASFKLAQLSLDRMEIAVTLPFGVAQAPQPPRLLKALGENGEKLTGGADGVQAEASELNTYIAQSVLPSIHDEYQKQVAERTATLEYTISGMLTEINQLFVGSGFDGTAMTLDKENKQVVLAVSSRVIELLNIGTDEEKRATFLDSDMVNMAREMDEVFRMAYDSDAVISIQDGQGKELGRATSSGCEWAVWPIA